MEEEAIIDDGGGGGSTLSLRNLMDDVKFDTVELLPALAEQVHDEEGICRGATGLCCDFSSGGGGGGRLGYNLKLVNIMRKLRLVISLGL